MSYATRWAHVWSVLAGLGVGFASLQWSLLVVVLAVLFIGASTAAGLLLHQNRSAQPGAAITFQRARSVGQRSLAVGCAVVAMSALLADYPALTLLVILVATLTSPLVVRRRPLRTAVLDDPPGIGPEPPAEVAGRPRPDIRLDRLDDDALFRLWRSSFWQLDRQPTVKELAGLVALRQSCLDELGRRNPAALQAWLDSGARASGGPERFWKDSAGPGSDGDADP